LTASEIRSAKKYWHVSHSPDQDVKIFPSSYKANVLGIMWQMMAQFQTWFGNAPYLMYGIQLLPLTPISEARDGLSWPKEMYPSLAESCDSDVGCTETGWSVLQVAMLATVGHQKIAADQVANMARDMFDGPAGDGHSRTNMLWYTATRPKVDKPLSLDSAGNSIDYSSDASLSVSSCNVPETCTDYVLDTIAGLYSCRQRIQWLIQHMGQTRIDACTQVAVFDHPDICGQCNPTGHPSNTSKDNSASRAYCPPCTKEECASDLNRCPRYKRTYSCTVGSSAGGCSENPWETTTKGSQCTQCCELTDCPSQSSIRAEQHSRSNDDTKITTVDSSSDCPACSAAICGDRFTNRCPADGSAPYLCYAGTSSGGCAPRPWAVGAAHTSATCEKCCSVGAC